MTTPSSHPPKPDEQPAVDPAAGPVLHTERLLLRRPTLADLDGFAMMNADPEVMRYIGAGRTRTRAETRTGLDHLAADWDRKGYGLFSVELSHPPAPASGVPGGVASNFLGWVTLTEPLYLPQVLPSVEIGWRFLRARWGHGYATEAAQATLRFAFEDRGFDHLVSIRHPGNDASRRVMEKIGLDYARETTVPATGQQVVVHHITRTEYEQRNCL